MRRPASGLAVGIDGRTHISLREQGKEGTKWKVAGPRERSGPSVDLHVMRWSGGCPVGLVDRATWMVGIGRPRTAETGTRACGYGRGPDMPRLALERHFVIRADGAPRNPRSSMGCMRILWTEPRPKHNPAPRARVLQVACSCGVGSYCESTSESGSSSLGGARRKVPTVLSKRRSRESAALPQRCSDLQVVV